jgi:hypothetical protein
MDDETICALLSAALYHLHSNVIERKDTCGVDTRCSGRKLEASNPPPIVNRLDLSGSDGHHITLTAEALQSVPRQTVRVHNPHTKSDETYQGVELSVLLARLDAPLGEKLRGNALAMYVVAEGTDKYRAIYSLAEIDPAFHITQER